MLDTRARFRFIAAQIRPAFTMFPRIQLSTQAQRRLSAVQSAGIVAALLAATIFFAYWVDQFYPLKHWLFFHYAAAWLYVSLFVTSSLCAGWLLCAWLLPKSIPIDERLVFSLALGVLTFFYGTFAFGMFNGYGRLFFLLWPLILVGIGGPRLVSDLFGRYSPSRMLAAMRPRSTLQLVAAAFIIISVVGIYLQLLNPANLSYDARWYHLPIAEYYTATGGIRRFEEGWYLGTYPQLANLLYAWALQSQGSLFDHVLVCTHLEFVLFLATLYSISVFAARLLKRERLPFAAAVVFLFPEIFAYDSNLNGGADHVLAFWSAALGVALVRLGSEASVRDAIVAALIMAGALLTKYQAVYLLAPTVLLVAYMGIRRRRWRMAWIWMAVVVAGTAPHWAKNWVYYRDPLYPLLHGFLPSRPFYAGAEKLLNETYWPKQFSLEGSLRDKVTHTLSALLTFSFVPNDWPEFHGKVPIFGSLFTLMLPVLLILKATRRLWLTVLSVHIGLVVWYVLSHQDRFLQSLLPWMAAVTAALLALLWQRGAAVKWAAALLVGFQWVWGADVYFFRTHSMSGDSPIRATAEFLGRAIAATTLSGLSFRPRSRNCRRLCHPTRTPCFIMTGYALA